MFRSKANKAAKVVKEQPVFKQDYFINCHRTYSCIHCRAHLANHDELISKLFQGNHGRAYLFNKVVNIGCKQAVQRELLTGLHAVADIYCDNCETTLGWKYEQAFAPSQKYKEGKYIIELVHMLKENNWDLTSYNTRELLEDSQRIGRQKSKLMNISNFVGSASRYDFNSSIEDKSISGAQNTIERRALSLDLSQANVDATTVKNNRIVARRLTNTDDQSVAATANHQQQQLLPINHESIDNPHQTKQNPPPPPLLDQNSEINKQ